MNKKGAEDLLLAVGYIVLFVVAASFFLYWLGITIQGKTSLDQIRTKEVALLIDSARLGSKIFVNQNISIEGNNVQSGIESYEFFTNYRVSSKESKGGIEISVG